MKVQGKQAELTINETEMMKRGGIELSIHRKDDCNHKTVQSKSKKRGMPEWYSRLSS